MSINLLCHAKSTVCIISIIINTPAIAYAVVNINFKLSMLKPKQNDLTSVLVTMQLPYCAIFHVGVKGL